jgi:hypothetical protein
MDSSVVNKQIKSVIRPVLQEAGFTQFNRGQRGDIQMKR